MPRYRFWQVLDSAAHFLHLPRWLLRVPCDRHERMIWAEFDTTEDDIDAMMAAGVPADLAPVTGWYCPHLTMTASPPGCLATPPEKSFCDCTMHPLYTAATS